MFDEINHQSEANKSQNNPITKISHRIIYANTLAAIFLFPLFFLTTTSNYFQFNKLALLVLLTSINLVAWAAHVFFSKKPTFTRTPFTLPLIAYATVTLISAAAASGYIVEQLVGRASLIPAFIILILVAQNTIKSKEFISHSIYALISSATILSIISIFQSFGFGLSNIINRISGTQLTHDLSFTPAGSPLAMLSLVTPILLLTITIAIKTKDNLEKIALFLISAVMASGVILSIFYSLPGKDTSPIILSPQVSYSIAIETIKNTNTALLGFGPESFLNAFTQSKPVNHNLSEFWNIRFSSSGTELFHIITTTGILGLLAWAWLAVSMLKQLKTNLPGHHQVIKLTTIAFLFLHLLLPGTFMLLAGFFFLTLLWSISLKINRHESVTNFDLSASKINLNQGESNRSISILPATVGSLGLILAIIAMYFGGRAYAAENLFKRSLDAANRDDGNATYEFQNRAIQNNPYLARYRRAYSATNLALANSLSGEEELTEEDQAIIGQLIQQSIREAKAAVTLDPQNVVNWESLVLIYRSLIGVAQEADEWTTASLVEAIGNDPTNPALRLELGGIYFALGQFDQAIRLFQQATELKPDWANAYYNLSAAHLQKQEPIQAFNYLRQTVALLEPDSADYTRAREELEALAEEIRPLIEEQLAEQEALPEAQGQLQAPEVLPEQDPDSQVELPGDSGPADLGTQSNLPDTTDNNQPEGE